MKLGSIEMRNTVPVAKVGRHVLGVWLRLLFGLVVLLAILSQAMRNTSKHDSFKL